MPERIPFRGYGAAAGSGQRRRGCSGNTGCLGVQTPPRRGRVSAVPWPMALRLGQGQGGAAHGSTSKRFGSRNRREVKRLSVSFLLTGYS